MFINSSQEVIMTRKVPCSGLWALAAITLLVSMIGIGVTLSLILPAQPSLRWNTQILPVTTPVCGAWHVETASAIGLGNSRLLGIAPNSVNDIWAVGYSENSFADEQALIEHWDGSHWTQVPYPDTGNGNSSLQSITALGSDDVWAVGKVNDDSWIIHWDGSIWQQIPSPNGGSSENVLEAVTAIAKDDIWAVGSYGPYRLTAQILHWNGVQWSIVPSPLPSSYEAALLAITAIAKNDVWAVGYYGDGSGTRALFEHWDGSQWHVVREPSFDPANTGNEISRLYGVSALAPNNVWAVGATQHRSGVSAVILHWDGNQWVIVPNPDYSDIYGLQSLVAIASDNIWAFGGHDYFESGRTLVEHWDGSRWDIVPSPDPANKQSFEAAALLSPDIIGAVGYAGDHAMVVQFLRSTCATSSRNGPSTPAPLSAPTVMPAYNPLTALPHQPQTERETVMDPQENTDYASILRIVTQWPPSQRFALVQDVLKTLAPPAEETRPRRKTLHEAEGLLATDQPPPTDEQVQQWLDERRMEKYGPF